MPLEKVEVLVQSGVQLVMFWAQVPRNAVAAVGVYNVGCAVGVGDGAAVADAPGDVPLEAGLAGAAGAVGSEGVVDQSQNKSRNPGLGHWNEPAHYS